MVKPDDLARVHFYLGLATEMQGNFDPAIQEYDTALKLDRGLSECAQARKCALKCKEDWLFLTGTNTEGK